MKIFLTTLSNGYYHSDASEPDMGGLLCCALLDCDRKRQVVKESESLILVKHL